MTRLDVMMPVSLIGFGWSAWFDLPERRAYHGRMYQWPGRRSLVCAGLLVAGFLRPDTAAQVFAQLSEQAFENQIQRDLAAGQIPVALDHARVSVGQYPDSAILQQLLGVAEFKSGMNDEARRAFHRAIKLNATIPQNYFDLALVDLSENRLPEAAESLRKSLDLDPRNPQALLLLGRAYQNMNETDPALEQFRKAVALAPKMPLVHYHLGFALQSKGKRREALAEFKKEIEFNPGFYNAYWLAGDIELDEGNLDEAQGLFERGIRVEPRAFQAHYGVGRVFLARQQFAAAESELKKALDANPNDPEIHYALARTYQRIDPTRARRELEIVAELHRHNESRTSGIAGQN